MKTKIKSHLIIWFVFIIVLLPIVLMLPNSVKFPPGYNVKLQAFFLFLTVLISFYGSSYIVLKTVTKKKINWYYYSIAAILGLYSTINILFRSVIPEIYQLTLTLHLDVFMFFTMWGTIFQLQMIENNKNNEVRLELNKAQLAMLRSQINPHFLYNTLHNIDALIYKEPSKASQSVMMLSDIMRYMLKDVPTEQVELIKEIEHLTNYIALERLRLKNDKFVNFQMTEFNSGLGIAPMLLIPFVENAFKHAVDSDRENGIKIQLTVKDTTLNFSCENSYDESDTEKDNAHGIGLETVRKRLKLLYPDSHQLIINKEQSVFKVKLVVQLNAH